MADQFGIEEIITLSDGTPLKVYVAQPSLQVFRAFRDWCHRTVWVETRLMSHYLTVDEYKRAEHGTRQDIVSGEYAYGKPGYRRLADTPEGSEEMQFLILKFYNTHMTRQQYNLLIKDHQDKLNEMFTKLNAGEESPDPKATENQSTLTS